MKDKTSNKSFGASWHSRWRSMTTLRGGRPSCYVVALCMLGMVIFLYIFGQNGHTNQLEDKLIKDLETDSKV